MRAVTRLFYYLALDDSSKAALFWNWGKCQKKRLSILPFTPSSQVLQRTGFWRHVWPLTSDLMLNVFDAGSSTPPPSLCIPRLDGPNAAASPSVSKKLRFFPGCESVTAPAVTRRAATSQQRYAWAAAGNTRGSAKTSDSSENTSAKESEVDRLSLVFIRFLAFRTALFTHHLNTSTARSQDMWRPCTIMWRAG